MRIMLSRTPRRSTPTTFAWSQYLGSSRHKSASSAGSFADSSAMRTCSSMMTRCVLIWSAASSASLAFASMTRIARMVEHRMRARTDPGWKARGSRSTSRSLRDNSSGTTSACNAHHEISSCAMRNAVRMAGMHGQSNVGESVVADCRCSSLVCSTLRSAACAVPAERKATFRDSLIAAWNRFTSSFFLSQRSNVFESASNSLCG
mmetsp:Transcript_24695/g.49493  ORF Transcript_24695/g.49493 Transcript_24695/m.49493 type:complete len:205 (+) Transcript_24695:2314-2928(+)